MIKTNLMFMRNKMTDDEKKQKVTFSINEKLNELLDKQIEKEGIKKSQLIEKILKEHFNKK
jgi:metal-responsive CopG/Arc/MetJ family transcriptional regulator